MVRASDLQLRVHYQKTPGILLGILGGGVPPGSSLSDPFRIPICFFLSY